MEKQGHFCSRKLHGFKCFWKCRKRFFAIKSTEVFSLQRKIFPFSPFYRTLNVRVKWQDVQGSIKWQRNIIRQVSRDWCSGKSLIFKIVMGLIAKKIFSAIPEVFKFLQSPTKKKVIPVAWFFQNTFGEKELRKTEVFTLWSTTILFYSVWDHFSSNTRTSVSNNNINQR